MKIAFLTAGGIAPCLSASIGGLIHAYNRLAPDAELIGYLNGYHGLLLGNSYAFPQSVRDKHEIFYRFGGSPIGNSRVKLTNVKDCTKRGLVKEGEIPLKVAADQLVRDGVKILHTIGGDDTNTTAADLAAYLKEHGYELTVVGLPKTIDNDVYPIAQTLGAWTAAEQGARFFRNIANENTTSYRQLIVHEVMGRNCGWLTARTAFDYRQSLHEYDWLPEALLHNARWDLDAVWVPELEFDFDAEVERLRRKMDEHDSVNIFLSEGAGVEAIVHQIETETGESVPRDAFGHVRLDEINVGNWFANQLRGRLSAEKVLVQKSGYFARSAAPNAADLDLIVRSAAHAAEGALQGRSGVAGLDEDNGGEMNIIPFPKIKGGKPFDHTQAWFRDMLGEIGQPLGKPVTVGH
ncbi:MAG: pyrophosphate--fructose-6-phosphate 1-phosphotransferase [Akkermansiaceae bacterium]|nr:pyrophosphate--fructose-6-phosphate 1-phosphotransferase [Akkermansiaceae bacterium]MCP5550802.1 pyrophosphate--fructose-6-phosphate 1-phosphotransferase [Akkermansiaceae bacterium]